MTTEIATSVAELREIAELCGPDGSETAAGDVASQVELWLSGRKRAEANAPNARPAINTALTAASACAVFPKWSANSLIQIVS